MTKRKRLLGVVLAFFMALAFMPQMAFAEPQAGSHDHCICGGSAASGNHTSHKDKAYQPWDGTSAIVYDSSNTAYVYLTDNVTISSNLEITGGKTLYLCLNGKTFASNGINKIVVKDNSRLVLCDCAGGGTIKGASNNGWGGGAVYLYNSIMDMYGGKITGTVSKRGAIALDDKNCIFNMYGGEISANRANEAGSAIFLNGTPNPEVKNNPKASGTVNLYNGKISGNRAPRGGAIHMQAEGTLNINGGKISGNSADTQYGGAIYLNSGGTVKMTGGEITENTAFKDGGAMCLYAADFTFSGGRIAENTARHYGGAVYLDNFANLNMTGGEISGNKAAEEGGAVHVYGKSAVFALSGGGITGNSAKDGGAVYLNQENSTLDMAGGEISGNTASRYGGAVYLFRETSTLNLSGGRIRNNTAGGNGGAVYFNTTSDNKIQGILNISGNPQVKENTVSEKADNIALKDGKTLSITGKMTDGAYIGITTESTAYPVVFSNAYDENYAAYFFTDDTGNSIYYTSEKKLAAVTNDWNEPVYTWSEDHSTVTAERTYKTLSSCVEKETVKTTVQTIPGAYSNEKTIVYTAAFTNPAFEEQAKTVIIPADSEQPDPKPSATETVIIPADSEQPDPKPSAKTYAAKSFASGTFSGKTITVKWNRIRNASGYEIYAANCSAKGALTKKANLVKTVKKASTFKASLKSLKSGRKLSAGQKYKVQVKAYRIVKGKKQYLTSSPVIHLVSASDRTYTNAKKITVSKNAVTLSAGKSKTVKAKVSKKISSKKLLPNSHVRQIRWYSANSSVAAVSRSGKITAKKKGSCTVYAVAANGLRAAVKVTVK